MEWFVCICWFCSSEFVIFLYFCENQYLHIYSEKFFGMSYFDLKVLPMKSSHSQLHFSYIWCIHISHQSKVTCIFLSKSARLITLDQPYHIQITLKHWQNIKIDLWGLAIKNRISLQVLWGASEYTLVHRNVVKYNAREVPLREALAPEFYKQ